MTMSTQFDWRDVPCKPWTGARTGTKGGTVPGYGVKRVGPRSENRSVGVHRLALEERLGRPIKPGHHAAHRCDNSLCHEPLHIFEATPRQNEQDKISKGRRNDMRPQQLCSRGHPLHEFTTKTGKIKRRCRTCDRDTMRRLRAAKRGDAK